MSLPTNGIIYLKWKYIKCNQIKNINEILIWLLFVLVLHHLQWSMMVSNLSVYYWQTTLVSIANHKYDFFLSWSNNPYNWYSVVQLIKNHQSKQVVHKIICTKSCVHSNTSIFSIFQKSCFLLWSLNTKGERNTSSNITILIIEDHIKIL